jgi:collagenase-like PrtC family protease
MNYQQSFEPRRRPSQRHDYHRLPVHGSHAMRTNNTRKYAFPVAMGILAVIVVLMLVL